MPLVLGKNPALLSLQPLAEEVDANKPPVINTYSPQVEDWRREVWDLMPPQLKARPDAAILLDKNLYVLSGESSGNDKAVGDGGAAWGGYQDHHIPAGSDRTTQIKSAWGHIFKNPDQWTDWGEGTTYNGQIFGALGNKPYNGGSSGSTAGASIGQGFNKPNLVGSISGSILSNPVNPDSGGVDRNYGPNVPGIGSSTGSILSNPVNMETGGVDQPYGPRDTTYGQDYIDAPSGSPRAALEDIRQGKDQLGNAALALGTALPIIGAGPVAGPLGVVGGEVGHSIDEKLGLPQANLPIIGKVGPAMLAGAYLGSKGETALSPTAIGTAANEGLTTAAGRSWTNAVKPNLRVVQPGERPGMLNVVGKNQPDPADFIRRAREMGMSDEEIRQAFPGALEAAGGIDTAPQVAARTQLEQNAKGAAAKRTYERIFAQHEEDLKAEGYSDAEAKQIATGLASREARRAAGAASEALPEQKPNVLATDETRTAMQEAQDKLRGGNAAVETPSGIPYDKPTDALTAEADKLDNIGGTGRSSIDQTIADIATGAKRLGDPASEIRRQLQQQGTGQIKSRLQQIIDDEQQGKQHPDQLAPPEQLNMLDDVLGQMSMQDAVTKGPGKLEIPPNTTGAAMKLDAASVAERARLSAEYAKTSGGPQLSETEFRQQWNNVKTARDGGRRWPENWTQEKINAYQKLEQGLTGDTDPLAKGIEGQIAKGRETPQTGLPGIEPPVEKSSSFAADVYNEINALAGKSMSLKSSISPPILRQGLPRLLTNPRAFFKEAGLSFKGAVSDEAADAIEDASFRHKWISPYSKEGVSPHKGFTWDELGGAKWDWKGGEDTHVPGYEGRGRSKILSAAGKMVDEATGKITDRTFLEGRKLGTGEGISERQAALQMNLNARGRFAETAQRMWDFEDRVGIPHDKAMYKDLVRQTENSMQHGRITQGKVPLLFSTQALSGRIKALLDSTVGIVRHPSDLFRPSATQEAGKNLVAFMGLNYGLAELASQIPGVDVSFNPLPSIRIGEHHYDMWAGIKPVATYAADLGQIFYKTAQTGDIDKGVKDAGNRTTDFLQSGLSPFVSKIVSAAVTGKDFMGRPYSLSQDVKSGNILRDLGLNFVVDALWDGFEADGLKGAAMDAPGATLSGGVNTYNSAKDRRNDAARAMGLESYDAATPAQRAQIDKQPEVAQSVAANPSDYRTTKDRLLAPINQAEQQAEQAFKEGKLSKPLPDIWHEQGIQRQQVARDLADQFKDMFSGFDKSRYDKAVEGYYGKQVMSPDGQIDFDATEAARQDYLKTLKPDERQWLDEALQVSRESKSPAHQKYLKYIDERKQAGYFDVKADDPDRAKKLVELDRKNPLQDALNWYWKGGTVDTNRAPGLNSPEAISLAMQMDPKRPATYAGLARPVNQTPQTYQAWQDYSTKIQNYYTKTVPAYQDQIAQDMFGVKYAQLPDRASRERVVSNILTQVRRGSPELEAVLQFFGDTADGNGDYVVSAEAAPYLRQLVQKYGSQPVKAVNSSGRPSKFLVRE